MERSRTHTGDLEKSAKQVRARVRGRVLGLGLGLGLDLERSAKQVDALLPSP